MTQRADNNNNNKKKKKKKKVMEEWRKLHNEELRYLYSSSSIIRIIKSRRMR
jgi:hypothetical protein